MTATYDVLKPIEAAMLVDPLLISGTSIEPGAVIELDLSKQPATVGLYIDGGWLVKRPPVRFRDEAGAP